MARKFWLKLSFILLAGLLCFAFLLSWFFSVRQAHRLNDQQKLYVSENSMSTAGLSKFRAGAVFLSYFWPVFWFGLLAFAVLFFFIFLYLKAFTRAGHFLFQLFGKGYKVERKKALSYLAHTNNPYLKNIRWALNPVLKAGRKKEQNIRPVEITFSDIIKKAVSRSGKVYPGLRIHTNLKADISLPVFSDKLFQSVWELIKNAVQALSTGNTASYSKPAGAKGPSHGGYTFLLKSKKEKSACPRLNSEFKEGNTLKIRTFKKSGKWFCCEVEDQGPGMDPDTMKNARALYFTTKKNFTGMGLTFVESVLSRMGGIMKLQSSESGGVNVCLFIPLDYIAHAQSLKAEESNIIHISSGGPVDRLDK